MTVDATLLNTFGTDEFDGSYSIAVDPTNGDVLVCDSWDNKVVRYSAEGTQLDQFAFGHDLASLTVDGDGKIWVLNYFGDPTYPRLTRCAADGTVEATLYQAVYTSSEFEGGIDIRTGGDGKLYLTSSYYEYTGSPQTQVSWIYGVRLSAAGAFEDTIGESHVDMPDGIDPPVPIPDGELFRPAGIARDDDGNVYIAENWRFSKQVQKFDASGAFVAKFGSTGTGEGQFTQGDSQDSWTGGMRIAIDGSGRLHVTDKWGGRVNVFDASGAPQGSYGTGTLTWPTGIAAAADGTIYVVDDWNLDVTHWDVGGAPEFMIRGISVVVCGDTDC